jgi:TPP-dependent pyruvate/acetoin dehydrogenase alpha subunit
MMAELYGKFTGCAKGKGGSMHIIDTSAGVMGTSAVVATTIPKAVGYAYAQKILKKPGIVVSFFGDGAVEEGAFHESLNFASLKKVPVLFVCENNHYAVHTPLHARQPLDNIYKRVRGYGIPSTRIEDGNDVLLIFETAQKTIRKIRKGEGPYFIECMTYRWKEHVGPGEDYDAGYRSKKEAMPWIKNDAVKRMAELLEPAKRALIEAEVEAEIAEAIEFAEQSPWPPDEELFNDLFEEALS